MGVQATRLRCGRDHPALDTVDMESAFGREGGRCPQSVGNERRQQSSSRRAMGPCRRNRVDARTGRRPGTQLGCSVRCSRLWDPHGNDWALRIWSQAEAAEEWCRVACGPASKAARNSRWGSSRACARTHVQMECDHRSCWWCLHVCKILVATGQAGSHNRETAARSRCGGRTLAQHVGGIEGVIRRWIHRSSTVHFARLADCSAGDLSWPSASPTPVCRRGSPPVHLERIAFCCPILRPGEAAHGTASMIHATYPSKFSRRASH